jgi:hypothetical protein
MKEAAAAVSSSSTPRITCVTDWQNPAVLGINKKRNHVPLRSFPTIDTAKAYYNPTCASPHTKGSVNTVSLDSDNWRFSIARNPSHVREGFFQDDFDDSSWSKVRVCRQHDRFDGHRYRMRQCQSRPIQEHHHLVCNTTTTMAVSTYHALYRTACQPQHILHTVQSALMHTTHSTHTSHTHTPCVTHPAYTCTQRKDLQRLARIAPHASSQSLSTPFNQL